MERSGDVQHSLHVQYTVHQLTKMMPTVARLYFLLSPHVCTRPHPVFARCSHWPRARKMS